MLNRKVIQWTVTLLLLIAGAGGYLVSRTWQRRDAILLEGIRAEVAKKAPDWDVGIEEAKLVNTRGQIRLRDIAIKPRGEKIPFLHIPECFITLDPDLLLKEHRMMVRKLVLSKPTVTLLRHADGTWNWQKLGRLASSDQTPEVEVESGSFVVRVEAAVGVPETEVASRDVALRLLPSGLHRYLIEGASQIDGAGGLNFAGKIDLNTGAWEVAGKADGFDMSPSLLQKAVALSPAVKQRVAELSGPKTSVIPGATALASAQADQNPFARASQAVAEQPAPVRRGVSQLSLPNLGLIANIALDFELRSDGEQKIPDYRVLAKVMEGQLAEPLSPVPLSGLQGELLLENDRIIVRSVSAKNGDSLLFVDGEVHQGEEASSKRFKVRATNLWLDPQIRELLSPERQKLFDLINPSGRFSIEARYDSEAEKPLQLDQLIAHDCTIRHELFPYPLENIAGTIEQDGEQLLISLEGTAADRPVLLDGVVTRPGPDGETVLHVQTDRFPIDQQFTDSIVSPAHQAARKAIESLNLTGLADIRLQFARKAGTDQKFHMSVDADVSSAAMSFQGFPYQIEELSGHVHYDPWKERVWRFTDLKGRHGPATLNGTAAFDLTKEADQLTLAVNAADAPLDQNLKEAALIADPALAAVWAELNPAGVIHLDGLTIRWVPGSRPEVTIPSLQWEKGTVVLSSFPYRWEDVTADIAWSDGRVELRSASGRHEQTLIEIDGRSQMSPAFFKLAGEEPYNWLLRLPSISVRNLNPRGEFAAALPAQAASVLKDLDPQGPIDAEVGVEMAGWPDEQWGEVVTSDWRLVASLAADQLSAGLDFTEVTGRIEAKLKWDGDRILADGQLDFERARALDMTFTDIRGPFSVNGSEVTVGSASVVGPVALTVPSDEQLTASLYGGVVKVNSLAQFHPSDAERSTYQAQVDVENADLSQWAREWGAAAYNVAGTVNGVMHLKGHGTSPLALSGENCWMTVTDARLGELPQMAQLLGQITQLQQPDKTAFRYAYAEFSIANGRFEFGSPVSQVPGDTRRILFDGNMLKMVGRGSIPFAEGGDPQMNLLFLSKVAERNRLLPNIPIISPIIASTMDNWIRIQVTGQPSQPQIRVMTQVPIGNVNDVLREIFAVPLPAVR